MESRADYVAAKVAENLSYEALLAIIATECRSPNQTAKMCLELGIAPEGEKIAKWVAVLKREFPSSRDFLGTLKRIYDQKTEAEMVAKSLEELSQKTGIKIIDEIGNAMLEVRKNAQRRKLDDKRSQIADGIVAEFDECFLAPWIRRLEERVKRFSANHQPWHLSSKFLGKRVFFNSPNGILPKYLKVDGEWLEFRPGEDYQRNIEIHLWIEVDIKRFRTAYGQKPFDKCEIRTTRSTIRQARALSRWMAKNNFAEIIAITPAPGF